MLETTTPVAPIPDVATPEALLTRIQHIEKMLELLVQQRTVQDYYSTADVARILGKAEFTVREWCRLGRVQAVKRACGRGRAQEWMIAHTELQRIQSEGLLPVPTSTKGRFERT